MSIAFELRAPDGRSFLIEGEWTRFGRDQECEVVVKDAAVSRHHLNFYIKDEALIVEDAGSQNGFLVNGTKPDGPSYLNPGDKLYVGSVEYLVARFGEEAAAPPRPNMAGASATAAPPVYAAAPVEVPSGGNKRLRLYIAAGAALAIFALFSKKNETPAPKKPELATKALPSDGYLPEAIHQRSLSQIRSEGRFREGMRDYNNGNLSRALLSFRDSTTYDPENSQAFHYIELTEIKLNTRMQALMQDGLRSQQNMQYRRAKSMGAQVLTLLGDEILGYGRKIASETISKNEFQRVQGQEEVLLQIPCDKVPEFVEPKLESLPKGSKLESTQKLCRDALKLIKESRASLGDEDVLREEGASIK